MMICCYVAAVLLPVVLLCRALVRDRCCGLPLFILTGLSLLVALMLGLPCHIDGEHQAANHQASHVGDIICFGGFPQQIPASNALSATVQTAGAGKDAALDPLRWAALLSTWLMAMATLARGIFLLMTSERENSVRMAKRMGKGVIRFVWHKVLRLKSNPPCCGVDSDGNAAQQAAAQAPSGGVSLNDFRST